MAKSNRTIQGHLEVKSRSNKTGMQNKLPRGNALSGKNENHLKCYQCTLKLRGIVFDFVHRKFIPRVRTKLPNFSKFFQYQSWSYDMTHIKCENF